MRARQLVLVGQLREVTRRVKHAIAHDARRQPRIGSRRCGLRLSDGQNKQDRDALGGDQVRGAGTQRPWRAATGIAAARAIAAAIGALVSVVVRCGSHQRWDPAEHEQHPRDRQDAQECCEWAEARHENVQDVTRPAGSAYG